MQYKTFLCCLTLLFPLFLMGQVIEEIKKDEGGLSDPDNHPFGIYFKFGLPTGSLTYNTGHQNINQVFSEAGIDIPKITPVHVFDLGLRYKRLYVEMGFINQLLNSPIPPFINNRYSVAVSSMKVTGNAGFSVLQNRNSALILRLGLGIAATSYDIRSLQDLSPVDFEDLLTEVPPNSSTLIYHENTFFDIGIEWWRGRAKSQTSFGEAIKLGYRRGINEASWEALDTSSVNAPTDRMGEFYLNVCFHLGYSLASKSK